MNYEREFMKLSGCNNVVTAGTNVSNMMLVVLTQSDNERVQNLFAYDKVLLIGFDYSWKLDGKYYAFDHDGGGKRYYMRHIYGLSVSGKTIFSSHNLSTSASWLKLYIDAYKVNAVQCGQDALVIFNKLGKLEEQIQYRHKTSDSKIISQLLKDKRGLEEKLNKIQNGIVSIARDHWYASQSI
jgi:hypothetical protein